MTSAAGRRRAARSRGEPLLDLPTALDRMLVLQEFDRQMLALVRERSDPLLNGTVLHPYTGLEAIAVGVAMARQPGDAMFCSHRGLGHCIAWDLDLERVACEVLARERGYGRGRGGHMHVVSPADGVGGTNGIVGASLPLAVGAAHALRVRGSGNVAVAFFGDGAVNTGAFHEAMNLAAVWREPVVFVCEDNGWTESMVSREQLAGPGLVQHAEGYGMRTWSVDGADVAAVHAATRSAMAGARAGDGPAFVVARVTRPHGHYAGDVQHARDPAEREAATAFDPVAAALAGSRLSESEQGELRDRARRAVAAAIERARKDPAPDRAALLMESDPEPVVGRW